MSHPVFLVASQGLPRNHHALFVQLHADGSGHLFNVEGNIQSGMTYVAVASAPPPETSETYEGKTQLGWVCGSDLQRFGEICGANPAPGKQFEGARRLYPGRALRRCQEWTAETVQLLKDGGVLREDCGPTDQAGESSRADTSSLGAGSKGEAT